jgi:hypothetical protein
LLLEIPVGSGHAIAVRHERSTPRLKYFTRFSGINSGILVPGAVIVLSVVSHGLFLMMPWPESTAPEMPAASEDAPADLAVMILPQTELDVEPVTPPPTTEEVPPVPEDAQAPPATETLLQTTVIPAAESPPVPPVPDPVTLDEPAPPPAEPSPVDEPPTVDEAPIDDGATPAYSDPTPVSTGPLMAYNNAFPHLEGAASGCFGFQECRRVSGAGSYRNVARSLIAGLEAQGYQVKLRDDLEDTGRNVYELSSPETSELKYLMVFSDADGSAVYVMSTEIMTLQDLQTLQVQAEASSQAS